MRFKLNTQGFTLVELLIVAPILILSAFVTFGYLLDLYGQTIVNSAEVNLQLEAQNVLTTIQDDLLFSAGFGETLSSDEVSAVTDPNEPVDGWSAFTTPSTLIVIETALTAQRQDPNRDFVRRNFFGCTSAKESNPRTYNNMVFFVEDGSLYRRILPSGNSATLCDTPWRERTCPATTASDSCRADPKLTDKIQTFNITYINDQEQTIDLANGGSPSEAEKIRIDITLVDRAYAQDISTSASITVKSLNET